jgi:UDP-2-acetamido-2-deoxy-ribo-hexuluronate aminotransferase
MKIPFYGIKQFYNNNAKDILDAVHSVYSGGMLFGEETVKLEKELCRITGRKHAVTVNSCTDAIFFALKSTGIKQGDEILVTSFSFIASATPIIRAGAVPVFVDIDSMTFLMNLDDAKKKITSKTKAIIGVHLFGQTLNITETENFAKKHNLILIEDAAQALSAKSGERIAGSMGLASCLSFDPTKVISAFGSGGALLTNDEQIYISAVKLRYHGKGESGDFETEGYNCRLSAAQCAIINYQIKEHLSKRIERLREIAALYNQKLDAIENIYLPKSISGNYHIYHKFVIRAKFRDELKSFLSAKGIETMIHYPKPLFQHSLFDKHPHKAENISFCHDACAAVLSLPIYPELNTKDIDYICDTVKSFYQKKCS